MSLVVCSNQPQDGQQSRNRNSIAKPWSFRNNLTSTYQIPENAQVALSSCKVNIPERVIVDSQRNKFYQWTGQPIEAGETVNDTTSWPVQVRLTKDNELTTTIDDMNPTDFAERLEFRLRSTTYHPNYMQKTTVERSTNASKAFSGYDISFDQHVSASNVNTVATVDNSFKQWVSDAGIYRDRPTTDFFTYTGATGVFKRAIAAGISSPDFATAAGIHIGRPLSLASGDFIVNTSDVGANANASGVEWYVGLSRYIDATNSQDLYAPSYDMSTQIISGFQSPSNPTGALSPGPLTGGIHCDFAIGRSIDDKLVVWQKSRMNASANYGLKEVEYWTNPNSSFTGATNYDMSKAPAFAYTRVKFTAKGEQMGVFMYNSGTASYDLVTEFAPALASMSYFKPISQSCWCLHPVLSIGTRIDGTKKTCTLAITQFDHPPLTIYDPTVLDGLGGWAENNALKNVENHTEIVDKRPLNDLVTYVQKGLDATGVSASSILILGQSDIYEPSPGANMMDLLGYEKSLLLVPQVVAGLKLTFSSTNVPNLAPEYSMFVKLNNLGQESINAMQGNRSKILAHLTSFENQTGKLTHEPSTLTYLDLNNAAPLNINEFDISFCYINEQFAEVLTGQSIVTLMFRKKPKNLM